jgi:hypothetical protein
MTHPAGFAKPYLVVEMATPSMVGALLLVLLAGGHASLVDDIAYEISGSEQAALTGPRRGAASLARPVSVVPIEDLDDGALLETGADPACRAGHKCPLEGGTCCAGGDVCCPFGCNNDAEPVTCKANVSLAAPSRSRLTQPARRTSAMRSSMPRRWCDVHSYCASVAWR